MNDGTRAVPHFTEFEREDNGRRTRRGEMVTVQRRGYVSFSAGAHEVLGSPAAVKLLTDREARVIGFIPCELRDKNAYAVRGKLRMVTATAVMRHMGADLSEARCYTLRIEDGLPPYIDLNEDAPVVTSNRRKAVAGK